MQTVNYRARVRISLLAPKFCITMVSVSFLCNKVRAACNAAEQINKGMIIMNTMIISAFPACGKTYLYENQDTLDF